MSSIFFAPPMIIFLNDDISPQVQSVFERQLYITETLSAQEFDLRVANDPNYPTLVHNQGFRILVIRSLLDLTNRALADIVLYAKSGLVSVIFNKFGQPGITLAIDRVYLSALIELNTPPGPEPEKADLDDGFAGPDNDDFSPFHLDPPPRNVEPV